MKVAVFSTQAHDRFFLDQANQKYGHDLTYYDAPLTSLTAQQAASFPVVCLFVNDLANAEILSILAAGNTRLIALRCTGFNQVDLVCAQKLGLKIVRVTDYSPHSVAEHATTLLLALNRKIHRAWNRTREGNFSLEGLMGFDLYGKTIGVIGTGKIGQAFIRIMQGFGCHIIATDPLPDPNLIQQGVRYVSLQEVAQHADILSLHCPLTSENHHMIDQSILEIMRPGALLINTGRGALLDTKAAIQQLKNKHLGGLGLDVYEQESELFFRNLSDQIITDDLIERLLTFPNVIITGHQGFFTREAIQTICETTLESINDFSENRPLKHQVS